MISVEIVIQLNLLIANEVLMIWEFITASIIASVSTREDEFTSLEAFFVMVSSFNAFKTSARTRMSTRKNEVAFSHAFWILFTTHVIEGSSAIFAFFFKLNFTITLAFVSTLKLARMSTSINDFIAC